MSMKSPYTYPTEIALRTQRRKTSLWCLKPIHLKSRHLLQATFSSYWNVLFGLSTCHGRTPLLPSIPRSMAAFVTHCHPKISYHSWSFLI